MDFASVPNKHLGQIEQLSKDLLLILTKKAKLSDEPICKELAQLAQEASAERLQRYDATDNQYAGF